MTETKELDLGPLTWVKNEIDQTLTKAEEALGQADSSKEPITCIQFAQTHLHQVCGALSIVGLDGLTQFASALEQLLGALAREEHKGDRDEVIGLSRRALASIGNYLEDIVRGAPDQSLRLSELYTRIEQARGVNLPNPADLFHPDLSTRAPVSPEGADLDDDSWNLSLRRARADFQRGLLSWLKAPAKPDGATLMRDAAGEVQSLQSTRANVALWWAAQGFFDALAQGAIPANPLVRNVCTRYDKELRQQQRGLHTPPESLLRDTLYWLTQSTRRDRLQQDICDTWRLDDLVPVAGSTVTEVPLAPTLSALRQATLAAKRAWNEFSSGQAVALTQFETQIAHLVALAPQLSRRPFEQLTEGLGQFAAWLRKDPLRFDDTIGLEAASALLLVEIALDHGVSEDDFQGQAADAVARLEAIARGERLPVVDDSATLDAARKLHERQAQTQVAREILSNLAQVEQALDDFFRNPAKRGPLGSLARPMHQVEGALALVGDERAVALIQQSAATIAQLAEGEAMAASAHETLAHDLSALGFYVQALQHGPADFNRFVAPEPQPEPGTTPQQVALEEPAITLPEAVATDEAEFAFATDLAETDLPTDSSAAVPTPANVSEATSAEAIPAPEPATAQPAVEIDQELLEIFLEEAHQVLDTITTHIDAIRPDVADIEALTVVRRGFHTLKGSGRMVGLNELGEAAWSIEQTLNRWLQLDLPPDENLVELVEEAHQVFSAWVAQIEAGGSLGREVGALTSKAEQLRLDDAANSVSQQPAASPDPAEHAPGPTDAETPQVVVAIEEVPPPATEPVPEIELETKLDLEPEPDGELVLADEALLEPEIQIDDGIWAEGDDPTLRITSLEAMPTDFMEEFDTAPPDSVPFDFVDLDLDLDATPGEADSPESETPDATPEDAFPPFALDLPDLELPDLDLTEEEQGQPREPLPEETGLPVAPPVQIGDIELSSGLYELFRNEAAQHIAVLEDACNMLSRNPSRLPDERERRAAHTLAGISGTARIDAMHTLARALEHAFERLIEQQLAPTRPEARLFEQTAVTLGAMLHETENRSLPLRVTELETQLDAVGTGGITASEAGVAPASNTAAESLGSDLSDIAELAPEPTTPLFDDLDLQLLPMFIEEGRDLLAQLGAQLRGWRHNPEQTESATAIARLLHTLKGDARMTGAMRLGEHLHQLESGLEKALKAGTDTETLLEELESGLDSAAQSIAQLSQGEIADDKPATAENTLSSGPGETDTPETSGALPPTLRIRADTIDSFVNQAGEIGIARTRIEGELRTLRLSLLDLTENVIRLRNQLREVELQAEMQMQTRIAQAESSQAEFDPLEMDRYTRLQELTRFMAESVGDVTTVQQNLLRNLDVAELTLNNQARMSRELQQALMQVRMMPFDSLADRLYRVVRQSAKELGKRVNLDLRGGRIELDRSVLETITAPLEHLLRNAVAHGIEPPDQRLAAGKTATGQITLTVRQEGNEIAITLSDDGTGLDLERIAKRARAQGLLGEHEPADKRRLTNMIFLPGFTTSARLSAVSGRGVGMDVVKSETASVGGRVEVSTEPGQGTEFQIFLPLTLAATQALLVRAGATTYAIPSGMIAQVMEVRPDGLERIMTEDGVHWQERFYPYTYLPCLLGDTAARPEPQRFAWLLLLRAAGQTLAVQVDSLRGNQEIVVKNAGPQIMRIVGITGVTVLGDGEIVLILNPVALASHHGRRSEQPPVSDSSPPVEPQTEQSTVMIVDDSLTVRKITGRLLEREGYRVLTAKDGVDALDQVAETTPDIILSDIEMPRMDGFDLLRNLRANARTRAVPVVMITSRLADKHREYAMNLGASRYLGKPYDEDELLAVVAELIH